MENPTYFATPRHFLSSRALFFITRQHNMCELFFPCSTKIHQLMALNYSSYSSATSPLIYMMVNIFPYQISTSTCAVWSSYQKSFASKVSCSISFDKKSLSEIFFAHNTKLIFVGSSLSAVPFGSSILTILFIEVRIIPKYSSAFATMLFEIIHQAWNVECSSFFYGF